MSVSTPEATARHALPYVFPAQAAKFVTHNEALQRIDRRLAASCLSDSVQTPPVDPQEGQSFIVPAPADGDSEGWSQPPGTLVAFHDGAFRPVTTIAGQCVFVEDRAALVVFDGTGWRDVAPAPDPDAGSLPTQVAELGINAAPDDTNRLAVRSPATLLDHEGGSHRLVVNRAGPSDAASVVFQDGYSGRAEFGLVGTDRFSLKVSADGEAFNEALAVDANGHVSFPRGLDADLRVGRINDAGGAHTVIGPTSLATLPLGRETLWLDAGRVYFSVFHVDRPVRIRAAHIARTNASGDAGALIRAGLFHLGEPFGNSWDVGGRILDYGTCSAADTGHHRFDLGAGVTLARGWYFHAVGASGPDVSLRAQQWISPGTAHYAPTGSGAGADFRLSGVARLVLSGLESDAIVQGFPAQWSGYHTDVLSVEPHTLQPVLAEWELA